MEASGPVFQAISAPRPNTIQFRLAPTHVAYANTLRRLMMTGVEMVGFRADIRDDGATSDVQILANSTPMTNEMLAHRVGLLPIHVPSPLEWDADAYTFELDVTNESDRPRDVTASDFVVTERKGDVNVPVPTARFFPPHPVTGETSLLAVLKEKLPGGKPETLHIKAKATLGTGRENARFIPTSQAAYAYTRDPDTDRQREVMNTWLINQKKIQPAALEQDPAKKEAMLREFGTLQIHRCFLKDENGEPYSFDFTIESAGVLSPQTIVQRACEVGAELCLKFATDVLPDSVVVQPAASRMLGWDFLIRSQDHTLGHLLQAWLDQNKVGNGEITFAGYDIPHPLKDEMVFRIGLADTTGGKEEIARAAFREAGMACATMFQQWREQWIGSVGETRVASAAAAAALPSPTSAAALPSPPKRTFKRPARPVATEA